MSERAYKLASFVVPFLVFLLTLNGKQATSGVDASILGMQFSMWKYGSFSLGTPTNPVISTLDAGIHNGLLYSAIAPGYGILSYPFAALGFALDGGVLRIPGFASVLDELFLAIVSSAACLVTYLICRAYAKPRDSLVAAMTLAFATPVWPFTTFVFANCASLLFTTLGIYLAVKAFAGHPNVKSLSSGVSLGLAAFVEYAAGLFVLPLLFYLGRKNGYRRSLLLFLGFAIGSSPLWIYNIALFSNPLIFSEQLKIGSSTRTNIFLGFNLLSMAPHAVAYVVSPYRGIVLLCPIALLGVYGLFKMSKRADQSWDAYLFASFFIIVLLFYSAWRDWSGGLAYGPRFLIAGMPYLTIPIAALLETHASARFRAAFLALFCVSALIQGVGALTTAYSAAGDFFLYQPLALNFPWLLEGNLACWWIRATGSWAGLVEVVFPVALFASLFLLVGYLVLWKHPEDPVGHARVAELR